jgi:hypothetical protein
MSEVIDLTQPLNSGQITDIVSDAIYRNYVYNRQRNPEITPFQWSKIFGPDTYLMEIKYQK